MLGEFRRMIARVDNRFPLRLAAAATAALLALTTLASAQNPDGYVWQRTVYEDPANAGAVSSRLVYGVPETDDMAVDGICTSATSASILFSADTGAAAVGDFLQARFVGEEFNQTYAASVFRPESGEGVHGIRIDLALDDPLWEAVRRLASISYSVNGGAFTALGLSGSSKAVNLFLEDCRAYLGTSAGHVGVPSQNTEVTAVNPPAQPDYDPRWASCDALRDARSQESEIAVDMVFVNRSESYRNVLWVGFDGVPVNYANLDPGQQFSVRTYVSQPWMITDGPGNCIEMMMPQPGQTVFEIAAPSPAFQPE